MIYGLLVIAVRDKLETGMKEWMKFNLKSFVI